MALNNLSEGLVGVRSGAGVISGLTLTLTGTTDGPPITKGTTLTAADGQAKVRFNDKDAKQRLNEGGAIVNAASLATLAATKVFAASLDTAAGLKITGVASTDAGTYTLNITSPRGLYRLPIDVADATAVANVITAAITAINADTACPVFAAAGTTASIVLRSKLGGIRGNGYGFYITGAVAGLTFSHLGTAGQKLLTGGTGGDRKHTVYLKADGSALTIDDEGTMATMSGALLMPTVTAMRVHSGYVTLGQVDAIFDGTNFVFTNIDISRRESF